eukprot:TRINITY_DN14524_c0_g1_i5.p1 TRINITY_DN14524_c0_g1~~TRINITY_DN14524_c0_g1_i5.p1  ORF type:complete len:228 (-),score=44.32 TRINITY_DN14524_c0_g1_i5:153-836(-)
MRMQTQKEDESLVRLYEHQVGGHHCIVSCNGFVFKPYNKHEAFMYSLIPWKFPQLVPFLPKFYGVTDLMGPDLSSVAIHPRFEDSAPKDPQANCTSRHPNDKDKLSTNRTEWLQRLISERFNTKNTSTFAQPVAYMKLQDVSRERRLPCVLDVKIGLRRSKPGEGRLATTTEALKLRLCGMHMQLEDGSSVFRDKYWGRKLTTEMLPNALLLFFYNGNRSRNSKGRR